MPFPEAIRTVAEKCGIAIPRPRERSPEERRENQQRTALVEMHREAAAFFARAFTKRRRQSRRTPIWKIAASIAKPWIASASASRHPPAMRSCAF